MVLNFETRHTLGLKMENIFSVIWNIFGSIDVCFMEIWNGSQKSAFFNATTSFDIINIFLPTLLVIVFVYYFGKRQARVELKIQLDNELKEQKIVYEDFISRLRNEMNEIKYENFRLKSNRASEEVRIVIPETILREEIPATLEKRLDQDYLAIPEVKLVDDVVNQKSQLPDLLAIQEKRSGQDDDVLAALQCSLELSWRQAEEIYQG